MNDGKFDFTDISNIAVIKSQINFSYEEYVLLCV